MNILFRNIVRAVIVHDNKMLIAQMKGAHSFLPGGGVEPGEGAKNALARELYEELGVECQIGRFLGVVETHRTDELGRLHHEVSHLFVASSDHLQSHNAPNSVEAHLEFYWIEFSTDSIKRNNVLPTVLQEHIVSLKTANRSEWITTFEL
ncbi:NUDIX domain-containing protein [Paenibacillus oceani]|uniref:NUDIX domain-containing protein n=1 Tax=Paenibacillus oceani TaxID=2772510 RepID=A0A927C7W6_9BACL|nr:NUDIX domain-containing protein [Paenibacillus oceani]MBD2862815.1 NUDIX domain-containing protein [Paenibacillus oceani]